MTSSESPSSSSSIQYHAIRSLKNNSTYGKGDILVLFGELFQRGYANGLVEEAQRRGMKIIRSTVGRRDSNHQLRPLTAEEFESIPKPFINIPLEAGFDLEPIPSLTSTPTSFCDLLKNVKLSEWESTSLPLQDLEPTLQKARQKFRHQVRLWIDELYTHIPSQANVLFVHLMAGGVPRTKIVMPLMNRSLKGTGDRYLESEKFWNSDIGKFCEKNFHEVTAETFHILVDETTTIRNEIKLRGHQVSYIAYGYHGTEILINNQYQWQTYTPYLQGWAKKSLEKYAEFWTKKNQVPCCVYNCPEILTNSSGIFQGVEISLYSLLSAIKKENSQNPKALAFLAECGSLLNEHSSLEKIEYLLAEYFQNSIHQKFNQIQNWPQHSQRENVELMLKTSDRLFESHTDSKKLMTFLLSEIIISACGQIMINDSAMPESSVSWINHDVIAKIFSILP